MITPLSGWPTPNQVQTIAPVELSQVLDDCECVAVAVHACGGPDLKYVFDFNRSGTKEEMEENQKTLSTLRDWLGMSDKK